MSKCRSCGVAIKWIKTLKGKFMPVDEEPVSPDDIEVDCILVSEDGVVMSCAKAILGEPEHPLYQSHFASCPDAKKWRKEGKK